MAVETAYRGVDALGVRAGTTVLVHGAGSTVGYAAVQIAVQRGARVIATAGETYPKALRAVGAAVTGYGDGMAERVRELAGGPVDLALDAAPVSNALPGLVRTVKASAHVLTLSDFAAAAELGVRFSGPGGEGTVRRVLRWLGVGGGVGRGPLVVRPVLAASRSRCCRWRCFRESAGTRWKRRSGRRCWCAGGRGGYWRFCRTSRGLPCAGRGVRPRPVRRVSCELWGRTAARGGGMNGQSNEEEERIHGPERCGHQPKWIGCHASAGAESVGKGMGGSLN